MKIAILDDHAGAALGLADWSDLGEISVFHDTVHDPDLLVARLKPFEVLCVMRERTPLPAALLTHLPALKLIVTSGPRNAAIALEAAASQGITVCGTASRKTTTAELALLLMLALNRRLVPEALRLRAGQWQGPLGRDLAGLQLGLIGLGQIGQQMAALGRALGMDVMAWSPNLTADRCAAVGVARAASLPDLMGAADVVSLHMVLSERTRGLVGATAFAAMRPGTVFINTSRAGLVDTAALLTGLRRGFPAMAGIDVFDREPLPADDPLNDRDLQAEGRLLLTPHLGYATEATFRLFYTQMVDAIRAFQAGAPIRVLAAPARRDVTP